MEESIYAPPEADVGDAPSDEPTYYVVGMRKFYLLSVFTANLYFVYWFYRNWLGIKRRDRSNIWPAPRGLFYIFFTHSLFRDIDNKLKSDDHNFEWRPGSLATLFVVVLILASAMGNLSEAGIGSPISDILNVVLYTVTPLLLFTPQRAINLVSGDPEGSTNQGLSVVNWVWLVLGTLLWLLLLFGLYAVLFAPELLAE